MDHIVDESKGAAVSEVISYIDVRLPGLRMCESQVSQSRRCKMRNSQNVGICINASHPNLPVDIHDMWTGYASELSDLDGKGLSVNQHGQKHRKAFRLRRMLSDQETL